MKTKIIKWGLVFAMLGAGVFSVECLAADAAQPEQTWTVNFKDTDILEVVKFIGEVTGKTIIVDPKVRGPIKVISQKQLNKRELYDLFLAVLDVHGFTAVESDGIVRIIANREARERAIPTEDVVRAKDDGYITQIIQLNNISAGKVLAAIRPLVPNYALLAAYEPSNALIISDTRANIARINQLIQQMDRGAVIATEVLQLRYAQAAEVVNMITQLEKPDPNRGVTSTPPIIVADKRINAVVVSGDEMSRQRIKTLVDNLDKPQNRNSNLKVIYLKYAKAADVAKVLTAMLQSQGQGKSSDGSSSGQANVQADEATNSVLVTADNDTSQSLRAVIDSLDIRRAQVLVEAIIVEIQENANKQMGVQWMYADTKNGFGASGDGSGSPLLAKLGDGALKIKSDDSSVHDTGVAELATSLSGIGGQAFGAAFLGTRTSFMGLLKLLKETTGTNILSTPNLLTTDNTKAKISVGQKVPFKTGSYTSTGTSGGSSGISSPFNTIQREDVGISLEVTPHINEGDSVVLDIKQEVSSISGENSTDGIITNQRKIDTQILAADGQTVVLGGLIKDDVQTSAQRVPLLGSIPLLGHLFRNQSSKKIKVNLLVFIRATIMRDDSALVGATAEKYKAIRKVQVDNSRRDSEIINPKSVSILPEWQDKPLKEDERKAALQAKQLQEAKQKAALQAKEPTATSTDQPAATPAKSE